jgi:RHS repeat-associated protein
VTAYYSLAGRLMGVLTGLSTPLTVIFLTDALGNLMATFSNTQGSAAIQGNQVYGPYGNSLYSVGSMDTARGYTGQYADTLTGLDYYVSRYYDPVAGIFLSADAVEGNVFGMNPYAYVGNNPETNTDPTGYMYYNPGGGDGGSNGPGNNEGGGWYPPNYIYNDCDLQRCDSSGGPEPGVSPQGQMPQQQIDDGGTSSGDDGSSTDTPDTGNGTPDGGIVGDPYGGEFQTAEEFHTAVVDGTYEQDVIRSEDANKTPDTNTSNTADTTTNTTVPKSYAEASEELANARIKLGKPPRSRDPDDGQTAVVLYGDGNQYIAVNGQNTTLFQDIAAPAETHAEINALNQFYGDRLEAGTVGEGGSATMFVDRPPCFAYCYTVNGLGAIDTAVEQIGLDQLIIEYGPGIVNYRGESVLFYGGTIVIEP